MKNSILRCPTDAKTKLPTIELVMKNSILIRLTKVKTKLPTIELAMKSLLRRITKAQKLRLTLLMLLVIDPVMVARINVKIKEIQTTTLRIFS